MSTLATSFTELRAAAYKRGMGAEFDRANRFSVKAEGAGKATPQKSAAAEPKVKAKRGMNTWERKYAEHLELERRAGIVVWYAFEPIRLRLGKGAWYTPDFAVVYKGAELAFHEVKGFWREAARVRIKVAATLYPFAFVVVKKDGAAWAYEAMKSGRTA